MIGDFRVFNLPANLPKGSPLQITYSYDSAVASAQPQKNSQATTKPAQKSYVPAA